MRQMTEWVSLRLPTGTKQQVAEAARELGQTPSEWHRWAIRSALRRTQRLAAYSATR